MWAFFGLVVVVYAAIFMTQDEASSKLRGWLYIALLILAIAGGVYFAVPSNDDDCTRYSSFANDC